MNLDVINELIKISITEGLMVMAPMVLLALVVGLTVGIFQTITSIQEQTLTFVPKLLAAAVGLWLFGPWMLARLGNMTTLFIQRAGEIVR